jgi:CRP-like cAMP-binding protein
MENMRHDCKTCISRKDSFFRNCILNELEKLTNGKISKTYKKGDQIFHEGDQANGVFCIYDGQVKVSKKGFDGKEMIIRFANPGDSIGFRAFIEDSPYTATAVATEETTICFIPSKDFNLIADRNLKVTNDILVKVAKAFGEVEGQILQPQMKG